MATSLAQKAKRAFVVLLLLLARDFNTILQVNRDSGDQEVEAAFKKLARKVHPDKGGSTEQTQRLNSARDEWKAACGKPAGPKKADAAKALEELARRRDFTFQGVAVLLTYQGFQDSDHWARFVAFVEQQLPTWGAKHWCATMETCKSKKFHAHLMLQFKAAAKRTTQDFFFEGLKPNASATDLCGEGLCRKRLQQSVDRGFFYVWADKVGTVRLSSGELCVSGNYSPCWTESLFKYQVLGKWPETLWKKRQLSDDVYESLLFLTRDGVVGRKRNLEVCRERASVEKAEAEMCERVKRIRDNKSLFRAFPDVPEAAQWLKLFKEDALRYPVLLVLGASRAGKTEWAKSLFQNALELKVGSLGHFPDAMRNFKRGEHDGVILDDVRDLQFLAEHQDKLQGKYDHLVEFGSTPGGTCAFRKDLFAVPFVVTINYSTANLAFLETHDWLSNTGNRTLVTYTGFAQNA